MTIQTEQTTEWAPGTTLDRVEHVGLLVARWNVRDRAAALAGARQAASDAVETIDEIMRELNTLRASLVTETRRYDDEQVRAVEAGRTS